MAFKHKKLLEDLARIEIYLNTNNLDDRMKDLEEKVHKLEGDSELYNQRRKLLEKHLKVEWFKKEGYKKL